MSDSCLKRLAAATRGIDRERIIRRFLEKPKHRTA